MKAGAEAYGTLLQRDPYQQIPLAALLASKVFHWSYADAYAHLNTALKLAADCRPALDAIADDLRIRMSSEPRYSASLSTSELVAVPHRDGIPGNG